MKVYVTQVPINTCMYMYVDFINAAMHCSVQCSHVKTAKGHTRAKNVLIMGLCLPDFRFTELIFKVAYQTCVPSPMLKPLILTMKSNQNFLKTRHYQVSGNETRHLNSEDAQIVLSNIRLKASH